MEQRLLITYSPKYAAYQKEIREKQIERAKAMLSNGRHKKNRKNPNDPARFIDKTAVTKDGEMADILYFLDEEKIAQEAQYDLSLIHISEPTRRTPISYAVFCLKKKI